MEYLTSHWNSGIHLRPARKKWVNHYFKVWDSLIYSISFILYFQLRILHQTTGSRSLGLSSRLGLTKSETGPKPTASPRQGWAGLGLGQAGLSGLRAWSPAQHITRCRAPNRTRNKHLQMHLWGEGAQDMFQQLLHFYRFHRTIAIGDDVVLPIQGCL